MDYGPKRTPENIKASIEASKLEREAYEKENPKERNGAFLNADRLFDHGLRLTTRKRAQSATLLEELMMGERRYTMDQKLKDFEILCANLLRSKWRPVAISMNLRDWTKRRYRHAGQFTIRAVHLLIDQDLIGHKLGNEAVRRMTRIWPKRSFMLRFPRDYDADKTEFRHSEPLDFVELRDSDRNPINYRDTRETNRIRYILRQNALVNDAALIQVHRDNASCTFKSTKLHAVFNNGSFDLGGRLYTSGEDGGYQHLSKEERKRLFINREPTVELDYSGLHPRMLYAWEGIQFPNDGDPYMTVHDNPQLRPLLKKLLLVFLNSKNDIEAVSAGNNEIHEMCQDGDFTFHPLDKKFGVTVKELLGRFKEAHQAISKYFCSGVANKVMNADSKIALSIIEHFGKRKIPILAIHDSFIVQRKYRDELHRVMDEAYQSKTGGFTCPIKEV